MCGCVGVCLCVCNLYEREGETEREEKRERREGAKAFVHLDILSDLKDSGWRWV